MFNCLKHRRGRTLERSDCFREKAERTPKGMLGGYIQRRRETKFTDHLKNRLKTLQKEIATQEKLARDFEFLVRFEKTKKEMREQYQGQLNSIRPRLESMRAALTLLEDPEEIENLHREPSLDTRMKIIESLISCSQG